MSRFFGLPEKKLFAAIFRICSFLFAIWGILAITRAFTSEFIPVALLTYTLQSNILTAIFFGVLSVRTICSPSGRAGQTESSGNPYGFFPRLSAFITFAILVTMLVFWLLLAPLLAKDMAVLLNFGNLSVHLVTPLLMLVEYLMFYKRGSLKKYDPLLFTVIPYCYLMEALAIGFSHKARFDPVGYESYYPYIFLDVDRFGAWVILMVAALTLFFIGLAYLWRRLDNRAVLNNK